MDHDDLTEGEAQREIERNAEQHDPGVHYDHGDFIAAQNEEFDADEALIRDSTLLADLARLLNRHSRENVSNTPDYILANALVDALKAIEGAVRARDDWYGIAPSPGMTMRIPQPAPNTVGKPDDDGLIYKLWSGKHSAWWRANGMGYTYSAAEAGTFTRAEAIRYVMQSAMCGIHEQVTVPVAVGRA